MKQKQWDDIRNEYITTDISYRKLAAKYDIPSGTLMKRAAKEKWNDLRKQRGSKAVAKTIEQSSDMAAARAVSLMIATDKVLSAILVDIERVKALGTPYNWKQITGALKDIKDIQTMPEDKAQDIVIRLETELEDWSE